MAEELKITNCPWPKDDNKHFDFCMIPNNFRFTPDISDIDWLPSFSFMLKIPFKLKNLISLRMIEIIIFWIIR